MKKASLFESGVFGLCIALLCYATVMLIVEFIPKPNLGVIAYGKVIEEKDGLIWIHYNSLKTLNPGARPEERILDFDFTVGYPSNSYPVNKIRTNPGSKVEMAYALRISSSDEVTAAMRKEFMKGKGRRSKQLLN